jgi:hypothetical protein
MKQLCPHRRKKIMPFESQRGRHICFLLKKKKRKRGKIKKRRASKKNPKPTKSLEPLIKITPPYVLQTKEQEEPGTNKEPEETETNYCREAESIAPYPNFRKELKQYKTDS